MNGLLNYVKNWLINQKIDYNTPVKQEARYEIIQQSKQSSGKQSPQTLPETGCRTGQPCAR
jgi:hypothetical protein